MKNILLYVLTLVFLGSLPVEASNLEKAPSKLSEQLKEEELRSLKKFHQLQRSILSQLKMDQRKDLMMKLRERDRETVRESVEIFLNLSFEEKEALLLEGKKQLNLILKRYLEEKKDLGSEEFYKIMSRLPPPPRHHRPNQNHEER